MRSKTSSAIGLLSLLGLASALLACGGDRQAALNEVKNVESACQAKDVAKASEIALKARDTNSKFKLAFDGTFKEVSDPKQANVCGGINIMQMQKRIENAGLLD